MSSDGARPSIVDALAAPHRGAVPFSVEFMPPKDVAGEERLWRAIRAFEELSPAFVSLTYGAGGTTRDRSVAVVGQISQETSLLPVAHLTAVNHSIAELRQLVADFGTAGVSHLLVLRGDPPGDPLGDWVAHPDGVEYAAELVELVRSIGGFDVGVAASPGGHYRSPDLAHDTKYLVEKLRAGAEYSITQLFFDVDDYLRLRDRVVLADPEQGAKPIIPELLPITSYASMRRMLELSAATMPPEMAERLAAAAGDAPEENRAEVRKVGIDIATEMAQRLIAEGVPALHFVSLNFAKATTEVLQRLGLIEIR